MLVQDSVRTPENKERVVLIDAKTKSTVLKIMVTVSFVALVIAKHLAQLLPINGVTSGGI